MPETAGTAGTTGGCVQIEVINPDFGTSKGIVLRQFLQKAEMLLAIADLPYEQKNKYKISIMPPDKQVVKQQGDGGWQPSNKELCELPLMFDMREESDCCVRTVMYMCGMLHLRPMQLHVYEANGAQQNEVFQVDRPFACGGALGGCIPACLLRWDVKDKSNNTIGMVRENYSPCCSKYIQATCCCTFYTDLLEGTDENNMKRVYQTRNNQCCFNGHNNFCGATCIKNDYLIDILDDNGVVVATMQKTYAGGEGQDGCLDSGFCRMCGYYSQYIVEFPEGSTPNQRALIITSIIHTDFQFFEKEGNDGNE